MLSKFKGLIYLILVSLIPTFLIWLAFFLRLKSFWGIPLPQDGMATIVANYDGPLFIVVAKSFYNQGIIKTFPLTLPTQYYAAHFPFFPFLIRIFSFVFGFPYSMLFMTLVTSITSLYFFNKLAKEYLDEKNALWLTFFFAIFPARWLIVRSVGSSEPLFIASIIASIYYFRKKNYWLAGISGALAQLTKSPGILLFLAYLLYMTVPNIKNAVTIKLSSLIKNIEIRKIYPLFLIPFSLILVFAIYAFTYKDFFAYFHSGDNIHIFFPPFSIFNYSAPWVGTFWLEEIIFVYLLGALALIKLIKTEKSIITWFFGIFFLSTLFVSHRDLIRYSLPLVPFALISFSDQIVKKEFRYVIILLLLPIYLFSLAYISQNVMPIGNWAPFL